MSSGTTVKVNIDHSKINQIDEILAQALEDTVTDICTDLIDSETIPYDTGNTQWESSGVNKLSDKEYEIYYQNEYVERIYFEPLNFRKTHNKRAGNRWMDPYVDGKKKNFAFKSFVGHVKGKI